MHPIRDRAIDNLRYIRETMERASSFTAVPGWGGVAMGITALAAAPIASLQASSEAWLGTWLVEALVALGIGAWAMELKSRRANVSIFSGPGRKFALGLAPALVVGALLTAALFHAGLGSLLPATWLLLYGTAVISAGSFSVPAVPVMGLGFLVLGAVSLICPATWGNWFMAAGFGALHIGFGILIARRHGG